MTSLLPLDGRCPACGYMHLVADHDGVITCTWQDCPEPTLVHDLLAKRDQHVHLVKFDEDGFTVQHPVIERLRAGFACDLNRYFHSLSGPPGIGLFRIRDAGSPAEMEPVEEGDTDFEVPVTPESPEVAAQHDVTNLIPLGSLTAMDASVPLPDNCVEASGQIRLPAADYPELAEHLRFNGFEPLDMDGVPHIAIDLPPEANQPPEGIRYVLRVR